ncbi:MAG: glycosyltransferase family 2 protein [Faecalimonas sp.]
MSALCLLLFQHTQCRKIFTKMYRIIAPKQSYSNLEIIIVDDGSTDKTGDIAEGYAEKYDHIRCIHKENGGLSDARNMGLKYSKGEYVVFFDSDDWVESVMS